MTSSNGSSFRCIDFGTRTSELFRSLLGSQDFSDVTLASEEGVPVPCHRVVLSAGSTYFKRVLGGHREGAGNVVLLPGLRTGMLEGLLDFLYTGEARVEEGEVGEFLALARSLGVGGLEGELVDSLARMEEAVARVKSGQARNCQEVSEDGCVSGHTSDRCLPHERSSPGYINEQPLPEDREDQLQLRPDSGFSSPREQSHGPSSQGTRWRKDFASNHSQHDQNGTAVKSLDTLRLELSHYQRYKDGGRCICNMCGKIMFSKSVLKSHMEIEHP